MAKGPTHLRLVTGKWRGRKLQLAPGSRPPSQKLRESLFAQLQQLHPKSLVGASVLDLFAGSGTLGIEALSLGASSALFLEKSLPALKTLRKNLALLPLTASCRVLRADCTLPLLPRLVKRLAPFDCIFCDPPFLPVRASRTQTGPRETRPSPSRQKPVQPNSPACAGKPHADRQETLLRNLLQGQLLSEGGILILRTFKKHALYPPSQPPQLKLLRERTLGESKITFLGFNM